MCSACRPRRELDLGLLDHASIRRSWFGSEFRHRAEALEGSLELRERLRVGPAALGLLRGQDGVVDGLLTLRALAEVVSEELDHLVHPTGAELLEPPPHGGVVDASPPLEQARYATSWVSACLKV